MKLISKSSLNYNARLQVYWPLDDDWYSGSVICYDPETKLHHVEYEDGDREHLFPSNENIKFLVSPNDVQRLNLCYGVKCMDTNGLNYDEMMRWLLLWITVKSLSLVISSGPNLLCRCFIHGHTDTLTTIRVVAIIAKGLPESDTKQLIAYARVNNKEIAEKNLDNRVDRPHPNHHMGSRGYPALATQMILAAELENSALLDDFDIWVKGVVDEASQKIINRFNEKVIEFTNVDESTPESQCPTSTLRQRAWDFINDEKNSAKHEHRLGKGSGPTITMLLGGRKIQKFVNEEMITKLTTTQQELQMTKEDLATTQLKLKANDDKL